MDRDVAADAVHSRLCPIVTEAAVGALSGLASQVAGARKTGRVGVDQGELVGALCNGAIALDVANFAIVVDAGGAVVLVHNDDGFEGRFCAWSTAQNPEAPGAVSVVNAGNSFDGAVHGGFGPVVAQAAVGPFGSLASQVFGAIEVGINAGEAVTVYDGFGNAGADQGATRWVAFSGGGSRVARR